MLFRLLAHADESHETTAESALHALEAWYIALPLLIVTVASIGAITYLISRRSVAIATNVALVVLLLAGVLLANVSALVSTVSIGLGFGLVLLQVVTRLARK